LPGYRRTTAAPPFAHLRRRSPAARSLPHPPPVPPALWRHPRLLLRHLLHLLLDDAIPSFIISCTSDFENSNNFLLPPGWRAEEGRGTGRKGMAGAPGVGSTRRVEMVPGC